jgi:fumarate reductase flavoprotein subunit
MRRLPHLVVGAGVAGLCAAIESAAAGVPTELVDAEAVIGGTLWYSSGHMSGAGTRLQRARGIADSVGQHVAEVERLGRGHTTGSLLRLAIAGAAESLDWLEEGGFEFAAGMPIIARSHEPYEVARTCWGTAGGLSILKVLFAQMQRPEVARRLTIRTCCRVVGLDLAATQPRLRLAQHGADETVLADRLTLATGGFGGNPALLQAWQGQAALYAGGGFADGRITQALVEAGAQLLGQGSFLPTLGGYRQSEDSHLIRWDRKLSINPQLRRVPEVFLTTEGRRFVNEHRDSIDTVERAFRDHARDGYFVLGSLANLTAAEPLFAGLPDPAEQQARIAGIPGARLGDAATVLGGGDFARTALGELAEIAQLGAGTDRLGRRWQAGDALKPSYFLIPCLPVVLRTWPGLQVDDELRLVLNDRPLPAVRCVGEMLGGIQFSGLSFASGMSLTPAITLGRRAGRLAAKEGRA